MTEQKKYDKLAVFDLDGTLFIGNSHIEILNNHYKCNIFDSILSKVFAKLFKKAHLKFLYFLYAKLPRYTKENFLLPFRESALKLLELKKIEGYEILIVSNAPIEIISHAAEKLEVKWLKAEIENKNVTLNQHYIFTDLFVCTDNTTDMNLLELASERVIYVNRRNKEMFRNKFPDAIFMEV